MDYRYETLEEVLISVTKDSSWDNMSKQLARLTSDERRNLKKLFNKVEIEMQFRGESI
jgi:hypothetical protein